MCAEGIGGRRRNGRLTSRAIFPASLENRRRRVEYSRINSVEKIRCAIIGPDNIGTDLPYKLRRSEVLVPAWTVGLDIDIEDTAITKPRQRGVAA